MRGPSARLGVAKLASPRRSYPYEWVAVGRIIRSYACGRPRNISWLLGFIARTRARCVAFFMAALARVRRGGFIYCIELARVRA